MMTNKLYNFNTIVSDTTKKIERINRDIVKYTPVFNYLKNKSVTSFALVTEQIYHELNEAYTKLELKMLLSRIASLFPDTVKILTIDGKAVFVFCEKFYEKG